MPRKNTNAGKPCAVCGKALIYGRVYCSIQCSSSAFGKRSAGRKLGYSHPSTIKAIKSPSIVDIGWIAGFLEGDGSFGRTTKNKNGSSTERVTARQKDPEPLFRLQKFLGGNVSNVVYRTSSNLISMKGKSDYPIWDWSVYGSRARGVIMTIYALMSQRRQQKMLAVLHQP